jgi:hypothetical protein
MDLVWYLIYYKSISREKLVSRYTFYVSCLYVYFWVGMFKSIGTFVYVHIFKNIFSL